MSSGSPEPLRCESRRSAGDSVLWRYSMAAVIVAAALLDVVWWVPAHEAHRRLDAPRATASEVVQPHISRCRRAQLQQELGDLEARVDQVKAEIRAIDDGAVDGAIEAIPVVVDTPTVR
ncbi:MAG: hypothetical protein H6709_02625 [Kofleriaceae bacterium]|nr:hypothetical protein [Myxococcales bacterium]MCB9565496.1 hypothetical protein [Kofleriaceae bacterium]MCB9570962.1 hypothetical protein [Kofleriaceae bacterium]